MEDMFICTERYQWLPSEMDDQLFFDFLSWADGAKNMYKREQKAREDAMKR